MGPRLCVSLASLERPVTGSLRLPGRLPFYTAWIGYGALCAIGLGLWVLAVIQAGSFSAYSTLADFAGDYVGGTLVTRGQAAQLYDLATQEATHAAVVQPYG